jgi:hypothetical protein
MYNQREEEKTPTEGFAISDGRNVLIDYYIYREC